MELTDLRLVTELAALAPSVHNTQPWRFELAGHNVRVWADPTRQLHVLDPTGRQLHLSCGAAVEFARLAIRSLGYACTVRLAPDPAQPTLLATLTVGHREPATPQEERLAAAIPRRYTDRGAYDGAPLTRRQLRRLRELATERGCWIRVVDSPADRVATTTLLTLAEEAELADPRYVAELATCKAPRDHPQRMGSEGLVLLGTDADDPVSWLRAGRALGDLLLALADEGSTAQPLGPVTDLPATRWRLQRELGLIGFPQLLLRVGRGHRAPATDRRRLDDVLAVTAAG